MPIYKYECSDCGHTFEDLRSFSDPNPSECPKCQGAEVQKLISGGNFMLKGSGWYVTDYANKPAHASSGTQSASDASSTPDSAPSSGASAPADSGAPSGTQPSSGKPEVA